MNRFFAVLLGSMVLPACSSPQPTPAGAESSSGPSCTAESQCRGCASCFDECLCGGGTAARCALSCNTESDAGSAPDATTRPAPPFTATLVTQPFDIPPGNEYFRCQNFANPFGRDVVILTTESFMTAGSHHMFVFLKDGAQDGELETCGGLEFGPNLHLAQRSQQRIDYPPGVGQFFPATQGLRIQIHYLNASSDTVHTEIAVTLRGDEPDAVPVHASQIFINTLSISVPAHSKGSADNHCGIPKDVNVFMAASHMHQHGTYFTARSSDGQLLYETNEWAEPEAWRFSPPRKLTGGSTIDIHCDYNNDSSIPLSFGESAASNEMCIFAGAYYPAADGESITCLF